MRKFILILLVLGSVFLMACSSDNETMADNTVSTEINNDISSENSENNQTESSTNNIPASIDDFPFEITVLEPNSINTIYMEATFINNSDFPVVGFNLTVKDNIKNDKTYLSSYDTVMPGNKSMKFDTFGPESGDMTDMEYLGLEITLLNSKNEKFWITYDYQLQKYETSGEW